MTRASLILKVGKDGTLGVRRGPSLRRATADLLDFNFPVVKLPVLSATEISETAFDRIGAGMFGAMSRIHERSSR